ncbi:MAG: siderophore-interacting protein [Acidimicrobiales bacterium]
MAEPLDTSALLQRLPGVAAFDLSVVEAGRVTPSMQRLVLTADGLDRLEHRPGQDLMVTVPPDRVRRRYTIRRLDRAARTVELQVVVHGDGPGARWAAAARPGDRVEAIGPRGKITVAPGADWHLFCGDESALPAVATMVESLGPEATTVVVVEVPDAGDQQLLGGTVRWLHRDGRPAGEGTALVDAVADVALPPGRGHAYLAGELRTVAAMRKILEGRGLAPDQLSPKSYWRRGVANAPHGEPA